MTDLLKIMKYQFQDIIRGKWLLIYAGSFFLMTEGLFRFSGDTTQVGVSLMNIILFIIPLVSIIIGSMMFYGSREFVEMLLAQPIGRSAMYIGMYLGLTLPLSFSFLIGVGLPYLIRLNHDSIGAQNVFTMLSTGMALTFVFIAIAFFISVKNDERVKGVGLSILVWIFYAIIFDGLFLLFLYIFKDYPLENISLAITLLNPIDLARILMLLTFDIAALMGYTGAVFENFFGSTVGILVAYLTLLTWAGIPFFLGFRAFAKKDL